MCRCAERRAALASAGRSLIRGDRSKMVPALRFVVVSSREDLATAFRRVVSAKRGK